MVPLWAATTHSISSPCQAPGPWAGASHPDDDREEMDFRKLSARTPSDEGCKDERLGQRGILYKYIKKNGFCRLLELVCNER